MAPSLLASWKATLCLSVGIFIPVCQNPVNALTGLLWLWECFQKKYQSVLLFQSGISIVLFLPINSCKQTLERHICMWLSMFHLGMAKANITCFIILYYIITVATPHPHRQCPPCSRIRKASDLNKILFAPHPFTTPILPQITTTIPTPSQHFMYLRENKKNFWEACKDFERVAKIRQQSRNRSRNPETSVLVHWLLLQQPLQWPLQQPLRWPLWWPLW